MASAAIVALTALSMIASPGVAHAQQAVATASDNGLEEIIVTARRREEKLQSVPMAVTAFSQAAIGNAQTQGGSTWLQ